MNTLTILYSVLLGLLGVIGYLITGRQSITALIPTFFGLAVLLVMFIVGRLAGPPTMRWTFIVLCAIGFAATLSGLPKIFQLLGGGEVARPAAAISQTIMAVISLVFGLAAFIKKPF
ncbi:MAG: hypothetical protein Kow0074_10040 [Candidatus Zixiibacteriota bacterium]